MKINCSKSDIVNGLNIVSKAVPSKTTMSILQCVLIDCTKGCIKLIANDTELGIETVINGEIVEPGIVALEAKFFFDIIRKLPDSDVHIQTDTSYITTITCEKSKFNIIGKSGEEFTYLPEIEKNENIKISQFTMRDMINETIFSIANNENNKLMTGELFEVKDNKLTMIALDGHRISIRYSDLSGSCPNVRVIVPGKTLSELSKILTGDSESILTIYITDKNIVFEFDNTIMVSRLIEGEYFNVSQMINSDYSTKVTIVKKEFLDCIDRATLLVKEGDKKPIVVTIGEEKMELKINSTIGSMHEIVDITKEGKDMMIGFNPKFLIDALRVIEDEVIDIYLMNAKAPCYIKDADGKYLYLVLPVNFNNVI